MKTKIPDRLLGTVYIDQKGTRIASVASGTNSYTADITPAITSYNVRLLVLIQFTNANTDICTLSLNGLPAKSIVKNSDSPLDPNDLIEGQIVELIYDGTNFQISATVSGVLPTTTSGEQVITITPAGPQKNYNVADQVVSASGLTGADFSTGVASHTGLQGQVSFDDNYRYDCIGLNQWRRSALNGNLIDLYLANVDDSGGDKTSSDMNGIYAASVIGQRVIGVNNLYEKVTTLDWIKIPIVIA
jgi:hypothetical protein